MRDDVRALLRCPHCGEPFLRVPVAPGPRSRLQCPSGHSFDAAKQGYYNFLTGKGTSFTADSAAMAASRATFLEAGHYGPLADALSAMVRSALAHDAGAPVLVDAGSGTGYYLHAVTRQLAAEGSEAATPSAVAFDISKFALRRAARLNPDAAVFVWDVWRPLPLADESADAVLVVFAPRNPAEFHRVLRPGGVAVVVTPLPSHLREIADVAGLLDIEEGKTERLDAGMAEDFELIDRRTLEFTLSLSPADVAAVALMGPAGHHLDPAALAQRTAALGAETPVTAGFTLSAYRPLPA